MFFRTFCDGQIRGHYIFTYMENHGGREPAPDPGGFGRYTPGHSSPTTDNAIQIRASTQAYQLDHPALA